MSFNWINLFQDNGIYYVTSGKNTGKHFISIKCPFCGEADKSQHLGCNLLGTNWTCWRDSAHRGATPERLLSALLGISRNAARLMVEAYTASNDDFDTLLLRASQPNKSIKPKLLPEFRSIEKYSITHKFWQYLYDRDFDDPDYLISNYNLKGCLEGRWKGRVIIPVYNEKQLIGWQGRSIKDYESIPKYLTSSDLVKKNIFNLQNLTGGDVLFVCEGPFDALKIDYYGREMGLHATCTFGVNFTNDQIWQIMKISKRYNKIVALTDSDSAGIIGGFALSDSVPSLVFGSLPWNVKDPGKLTKTQVYKLRRIQW